MTILDRILQDKVEEIALLRHQRPLAELQRLVRDLPPPRDFIQAVRGRSGSTNAGPRVIAEVKKASPSKGVIRPDFDPVAIARAYAANGASALSVLTDAKYFQGSLRFLEAIAEAVSLPLLRKDFILDPYQIYEARAAHADAILLIAAALGDTQLSDLLGLSQEMGLAALVEVHTVEELGRVLPLQPRLIGVNNRDLRTFHTDLATTVRLLPLIPPGVTVVSESGIDTAMDIVHLQEEGVHAFLIGESLMRAVDPGLKLRELLYGVREDLRHHQR